MSDLIPLRRYALLKDLPGGVKAGEIFVDADGHGVVYMPFTADLMKSRVCVDKDIVESDTEWFAPLTTIPSTVTKLVNEAANMTWEERREYLDSLRTDVLRLIADDAENAADLARAVLAEPSRIVREEAT